MLLEHIYIEFKYGKEPNEDNAIITEGNKVSLCESFGVIPNLDEYVSVVEEALKTREGSFVLTEKDFRGIAGKFFNKIDLIVTDDKTKNYSGGYVKNKSRFFYDDNGHLLYYVRIFLNRIETLNYQLTTFAHEITHAYDDHKRRRRTLSRMFKGQSLVRRVNDKQKPVVRNFSDLDTHAHYGDILNASNNRSTIADMLYYLYKTEINAFIGQMKQELIPLAPTISDSKTANDAIKQTEAYKIYSELKEDIVTLQEINKMQGYDKFKQKQIDDFNKITGLEYRTFNQLTRFFANKFYDFEKQFITNSAKIVYQVFVEYGPKNFEKRKTWK